MRTKLLKLLLIKLTKLNLNDFMKKLQFDKWYYPWKWFLKIIKILFFAKDLEIYSDKSFVIINTGKQGGPHWKIFCVKNNKSFYFHSFGGIPDIFIKPFT